MVKSRKGICSECHADKRLYGLTLCYFCYKSRQKVIFLSKGISFPKRLAVRPKHWTFEIVS